MTNDLATARRLFTERWAKWFATRPDPKNHWWQRLADRWRGPRSVPSTCPTKVSWKDIGCAEKPGSYAFSDGQIAIGQREIAIWRENPDGVFLVESFGASPAQSTTVRVPICSQSGHDPRPGNSRQESVIPSEVG